MEPAAEFRTFHFYFLGLGCWCNSGGEAGGENDPLREAVGAQGQNPKSLE